jgi:hypothetical protein
VRNATCLVLRSVVVVVCPSVPCGRGVRLPFIGQGESESHVCEGPIRRTREGGSEWEPIKILLEGDKNSNKTNAASNTRLRLTTKVGQAHVATGLPLDLGTNTQPSDPRNTAEKPNSSLQTHTGQTGEHHRSDQSLPVKLSNFH